LEGGGEPVSARCRYDGRSGRPFARYNYLRNGGRGRKRLAHRNSDTASLRVETIRSASLQELERRLSVPKEQPSPTRPRTRKRCSARWGQTARSRQPPLSGWRPILSGELQPSVWRIFPSPFRIMYRWVHSARANRRSAKTGNSQPAVRIGMKTATRKVRFCNRHAKSGCDRCTNSIWRSFGPYAFPSGRRLFCRRFDRGCCDRHTAATESIRSDARIRPKCRENLCCSQAGMAFLDLSAKYRNKGRSTSLRASIIDRFADARCAPACCAAARNPAVGRFSECLDLRMPTLQQRRIRARELLGDMSTALGWGCVRPTTIGKATPPHSSRSCQCLGADKR
jgi:hypothetical protein